MLEYLKMGLNIFSNPERSRSKSLSPRQPRIMDGTFRISLSKLIEQIRPLPPYSIVIGGCEDGMHFYLALDDPRPGSILVIGDRDCGKRQLMESIIASGVMLNAPRHLRYILLSDYLSRFNGYASEAHCYAALDTGGPVGPLIHELTDIFARRWAGQRSGPPILLLVNNLSLVFGELDERSQEDLLWLIQHGPQAQIWPIVSLHAEDFPSIDERIIESFGTYLVGKTISRETALAFAGEGETFAGELITGKQFGVLFDGEWLKFWIPEIDEVR